MKSSNNALPKSSHHAYLKNAEFQVLSYNIHKGFTLGNRKFVLHDIKKSLQQVSAEIICLQEVLGDHQKKSRHIDDWHNRAQFEFLADQSWPHWVYGKNAHYAKGHHGNAVLSKFPINSWKNHDISTLLEKRGILHTQICFPLQQSPLEIFCLHLGLLQKDRVQQIATLTHLIQTQISPHAPLIIAGDFNDWQQNAARFLEVELKVQDAYFSMHKKYATTFPAQLPFLKLDRIYFKNLHCTSVTILNDPLWKKLSDHLPLMATFNTLA